MKWFYKNKKLKVVIVILIILFTILSTISVAFADDSSTNTIVGDFFSKVFDVDLNSGSGILATKEEKEKRLEINNSIYEGTSNKTYSLYDRFGGNIQFIPYFGEKRIESKFLDRFYDDIIKHKVDFSLTKEVIKNMLEKSAISNNNVYEGRSDVLTDSEIEAGNKDPRYEAYNGIGNGGAANIGNIFLLISNFLTNFISVLSGSGLYNKMNDIWVFICNDLGFKDLLNWMVKFILPLAIAIYIISLLKNIPKVMKGNLNIRTFLISFLSSVISFSITLSLIGNPTVFSTALTNIVTKIDDTLDEGLSFEASEIVKSDINDNIREAALWEIAVFNPWCEGMFQDKYSKLYTTYDEEHKDGQMKQSNDNVDESWDDNTEKYNSAKMTGDINVPIGNNQNIKNWAALAWSCQSIYHIDAVDDSRAQENDNQNQKKDEESKRIVWPRATTTPMNTSLYVDNFRWLDAKLNISPIYYDSDNIVLDYKNSNNYKQTFIKSGLNSLFLTILLFPIAILSFRKVGKAIRIITLGLSLGYRSMMNLVIPEKYNIMINLKYLLNNLYDYLWWSIITFMSIILYRNLVGKNMLYNIVWVLIGILILKFKPIKHARQVRDIKIKVKSFINDKARKYEDFVNKKFNFK